MMFIKSCVSLLVFVSGVTFAHRISQQIEKQKVFPREFMTKIGTLYFALSLLVYFFLFHQPFLIWIFFFSSLSACVLLLFLFLKFHQHQFWSEFLRFLSLIIMRMQMGSSFRRSYEQSLRLNHWKSGHLFHRLFDNVSFSQQENSFGAGPWGGLLRQLEAELRMIDQQQHQAIDRLCNLRKNMQDRLIFRRRSRQVWSYFLFQVGLLSIIYAAIWIYVLTQTSSIGLGPIFVASLSFYGVGLLFVGRLLLGKQWNI